MTRRTAEVRLDALLRTAIDVIVERGLANTRTADVAAAAGVSQALVFYHFASKEALLAQAFAYAAEQDLARLDAVVKAPATPHEKLKKIIKLYAPVGRSKSWAIWIDGWSQALRSPEFEKLSRKLDLKWKESLTEVISAGVSDASFTCDDPAGAAWRITALIDGLAVQMTVHAKVASRAQAAEWIALTVAREVGLDRL
ncbi:AcrR family transcriptional regulator [Allocatelliglobosispora scoriae]|uniref:AcrR family transcriptional regulator n=1 Tax=Allocatelliglobosispora scoriae TaxID=643052 RepID=A0A841C1E3_9ACTN|nr:TetR/AcrR family transcriptional regulator [Allocatelliglobosispora scoriae]MBB5872790.1 AcrR family transcriptional regulator [Allocatelliglobosispora scoriae]